MAHRSKHGFQAEAKRQSQFPSPAGYLGRWALLDRSTVNDASAVAGMCALALRLIAHC